MKNKDWIPFNAWSRERIIMGCKGATSRHKKYLKDNLVYQIELYPWHIIRDEFFHEEGADTPLELQKVIEDIYKRKVPDDETFYLHFFDNVEMAKRLVKQREAP